MPKKFIYNNNLFILDEEDNVYRSDLGNRFGAMYQLDIKLNDTIEIIEEEKKIEKIKKLYKYTDNVGNEYYDNILKVYDGSEYEITEDLSFTIDKINELIDEINKLKEDKYE